jgi:hypothetical protein
VMAFKKAGIADTEKKDLQCAGTRVMGIIEGRKNNRYGSPLHSGSHPYAGYRGRDYASSALSLPPEAGAPTPMIQQESGGV